MTYWLLQGDPATYRLLHAALEHRETTWSARQSASAIAVGDKVVYWLSGDNAGAYAVGEVTAAAQDMPEDPRFVPFWRDPTDAGASEARIRATQERLMVAYPILRGVALKDDILAEMVVLKRAAGTVFRLTAEQYDRLQQLAVRPQEWTYYETVLALAVYRVAKGPAQKPLIERLSRMIDRGAATIGMALRNFEYLETGKGLPNASALARSVWDEYVGDEDALRARTREIEDGLLDGGGLTPLSDELRYVRTVGELRLSVHRFNREAKSQPERAQPERALSLIERTEYWVYDKSSQRFGPSKFVAFANLSLERYSDAVDSSEVGDGPEADAPERGSWVDLPADPLKQRPAKQKADGTHTTVSLALEMTSTPDGATLEEIDRSLAELPLKPGHSARTLLPWMSRERGWGFRMNPETKKIGLVTEDSGSGGRVDGFRTRRHIEKLIGASFGPNPELTGSFLSWADSVVESRPDGFRVRDKPKFLVIPEGASMSETNTKAESAGIYAYLSDRGLRFPSELVTTYLLALKTKPFVILSGISGTGKTKLAQAVAEWAGVDEVLIEEHAPVATVPETLAVWTYQLQPYNFAHRKIVVASDYKDLFERPETGSTPLRIHFEGKQYKGSIGAVHSKGRLLHEFRLGGFTEKLVESFKADDYVRITTKLNDDDSQDVFFERVEKEIRSRKETVRRYEFVTVRPDWLDGKEVLGFYNILTEEYVSRPFLALLLRAHRDPGKPYFAILDEMNLARVEHYFADLLSATESRKPSVDGTQVEQEPVHMHDQAQCAPLAPPDAWERPAACATCRATDAEIAACPLYFDRVQLVPPRLRVPPNVHVTGTVNIDETTHQFSPKVLDRANVIEFNVVDLVGGAVSGSAFALKQGVIDIGRSKPAVLADYQSADTVVRERLQELHGLLEPFNLHFGYRPANEMALYIANAKKYVGEASVEIAIDLQVLQKVLPKLHGSKQRLLTPLWKLLLFSIGGIEAAKHPYREEDFQRIDTALGANTAVQIPGAGEVIPKMPRSAKKLGRMLRVLREQGFVSFIE